MTASRYESAIRKRLHGLLQSASHHFDHLDRVVQFALGLQAVYGGDPDVIVAAALLHDLGRSDKTVHGADSARKSADEAGAVLDAAGFPTDKRAVVLEAIAEHDQPSLRPTTLEGRILKDADFLAGFGAMGIVRSALWTGESGGSMDDLLYRLEQKMPARIASLEFAQSRYQAAQEYVFVRLFLDKLRSDAPMLSVPSAPYVVIEGISGSGKSTQTAMLEQHYRADGLAPVAVHEPTLWYRDMKATLEPDQRGQASQLILLLADRHLNVRHFIDTALREGQPVISDRSYLSSMVYQGGAGWLSPANIAYVHTLVMQPTHLFVLDVAPDEALRRIESRLNSEGGERGVHETIEQLAAHRERFLSLTAYFPHLRVIDTAALTPDQIHKAIWEAVSAWTGG
jgi:dTMP kinase